MGKLFVSCNVLYASPLFYRGKISAIYSFVVGNCNIHLCILILRSCIYCRNVAIFRIIMFLFFIVTYNEP